MRNQQSVIIQILKNKNTIKHSRVMSKEQWVSLLKATGLDECGMKMAH